MRKIGFDVDGTVADDPDVGLGNAWRAGSKPVDIEAHMRVLMNTKGTWVNPDPLPGAIEAMKLLAQNQIGVVFISGIAGDMGPLRLWWLQKQFGKYLSDIRLYCRGGEEKALTAQGLGLEAFIDDSVMIADSMCKAGIRGYLVPNKYESMYKFPVDARIKRASVLEYAQEAVNGWR